jgi:hypothetical protein
MRGFLRLVPIFRRRFNPVFACRLAQPGCYPNLQIRPGHLLDEGKIGVPQKFVCKFDHLNGPAHLLWATVSTFGQHPLVR